MRLGCANWAMRDTLPDCNPQGAQAKESKGTPLKKIKSKKTAAKREGIVYILTNPSMPELVKIGKTGPKAKDLEMRIKALDNTNVALPFECYYAAKVEDANYTEKNMHIAFTSMRVKRERSRREFFEMNPAHAKAALMIARGVNMTPRDEEIPKKKPRRASGKARRGNFKFSDVNLRRGIRLEYRTDPSEFCTIENDTAVMYKGKEMSLSAAAGIIQKRRGKEPRVAGPSHWTYRGETLKERRARLAK